MKRNFCVIDIETAGLSARPESFRLCCLYGENEKGELIKKFFITIEDFKKYIFNQDDFKYVFAHNAEFDYTCIFDNIITELDFEALFVGSMFVKAKKDGVIFMNSLAILKTSVAELGKSSGDYKLNLDDKFKNAGVDDVIEINQKDLDYCYKDCQIPYDYLVQIFELTEKIKPTIASCAMEIFSKKFLKRKLFFNKLNEKFRLSYYGGRVECFRFGKIKPCYKYDVNSLYPKVCTDMYFPDFNKMKKGCKDKNYFKKFILPNYEGNVKVRISHKKSFVCVLPFRNDAEIIYPYGTWVGWYNFNELRYALKTRLVEIDEVFEYNYAPRIFFNELAEYMFSFFEKKDKTKGAEKLIMKFLLNALTGKFSQKDHGEKKYFKNIYEARNFINSLRRKVEFKLHHFNDQRQDLFVEFFKSRKRNKPKWNIPTISSYITSQARVFMLPFYLKYSDNLLYTDTDSLVLSSPMSEKSGQGLGEFKKEKDTEIDIKGNKHYHTKIKGKTYRYIKGVHKNHKKRKGKYVYSRMMRTKEAIRRGLKAGVFHEVEKNIGNDYTKRITKRGVTSPLKLNLSSFVEKI